MQNLVKTKKRKVRKPVKLTGKKLALPRNKQQIRKFRMKMVLFMLEFKYDLSFVNEK